MSSNRSADYWNRVQQVFQEAVSQDPEARDAFLQSTCAEDEALYNDVMALLETDGDAPAFLDEPPNWSDAPWSDEQEQQGPQLPDPYDVIKPLGKGGMGRVYLARRTDVGTRVALKMIRPERTSEKLRERFLAERRIHAKLTHPNIARVLDAGITDADVPFLVMEYVDGVPLTTYANAYQLSVRERLRLFERVCEAVAYAHRNLVVHRDLKPGNILITDKGDTSHPKGTVKLLDFGIAKPLYPEEDGLTRTGGRLMTPKYAAPEQIAGEQITTATDVYALGVLLYELLTGALPYDWPNDATPHVIEQHILEARPVALADAVSTSASDAEVRALERQTDPASLRRMLRGDLNVICQKALRKEPEQRYASAEQLARDVERVLAHRPIEARPATWWYRTRTFAQRNTATVVAASLALVFLLGGLGTSLWQARVAEQQRDQAQQNAAEAQAVSDFLVRLFDASDPAESRGLQVTARELLARGRTRIGALKDQPGVYAEMTNVMGNVYASLGEYATAESLLTKAVALRTTTDEAPAERAQALSDLGGLYWQQGRYAKSLGPLQRALTLLKQQTSPPQELLSETYNRLGIAMSKLYRMEEAATYRAQSLALARKLYGEESVEVAAGANNLAVMLQNMGRYAEALPHARTMLRIVQDLRQAPHPYIATGHTNVGLIAKDALMLDTARVHLQKALAMRRAIYGTEDPRTAISYHNLAEALYYAGNYAEARRLSERAQVLQSAVYSESHPGQADVLHTYGLILRAQGNYAAARKTLQQTLDLRTRLLGPDHPRTGRTWAALGWCEHLAGNDSTAARALQQAARIYAQQRTQGHPFRHVITVYQGAVAVARGRRAAGLQQLKDGYDRLLATAEGRERRGAEVAARVLSTTYRAAGQSAQAQTWQQRQAAVTYASSVASRYPRPRTVSMTDRKP
ncbi:serine/threonine-protein kinase [Salisaeta longa]|uniref:serine/threonine-protein kinase n=1 Tax=Salisaeta longa TaxID=503170 RepID=UPI0003B385F2|nr:serine/threonine-protein kinase [Salisaeta longa]